MAVLRVRWRTEIAEVLRPSAKIYFFMWYISKCFIFSLQSEDSMEHLSPEERACLMYLEETIEALELQEDSGISNDESDTGLQADTPGQAKVDGMFL